MIRISPATSFFRCRFPLRAALLRFFAICLAVVLVACGQKDSAQLPEAGSSDVASASPAPAPAPPEPIVSSGEKKGAASHWSDAVKGQLTKIAEALMDDAVAAESGALADQVSMVDPGHLQQKEVFQDASLKVVEITAPSEDNEAPVSLTAGEFVRKIRALFVLTTAAESDKAYFKLYGITEDRGRLKTRQRLMVQGARAGNRVDSYAVVDATWKLPTPADSNGEQPRLVSISMLRIVQSELTKPEAMFEDIAGTVLGQNAAWNQQLRLGMNTWVRHIERTLNPDFLGYHGVAIADVNGDGLEDLYLCQPGGLPNLLFQQQPDGTLTDVSEAAGVDWLDNSTAALLVDLDNDGDADLAVATRAAFLIMENNGAGEFSLRQRLSNIATGYSPTASDYDLDGDLDLLVLRYAGATAEIGDFPTPHPFHSARNGGANVLLQNQGDFTFADVTDASGLGVENYRFSFAASWEDFDNDGDSDLYIANDFGPNQLFRNDGTHFVDESSGSGSEDWGFGMSVTWADYNRDGYMDLYVSSMFSGAGNQVVPQADFNPSMSEETRRKYLKMARGNTLLRNTGSGGFADATVPADEGFAGWAWGAAFADFNNDGWEDLYVANGYVSQPDKDDL
ncbi:MAG: hypothetical protein ACI9R3_002755 [Verrucomicrobiales bacterium]|jgi:hypothetical protein